MYRKDEKKVNMMIDNIRGYFNNKIVGRTKQVNLRFSLLFRGFIAKYWFADQEIPQLYKDYNRIIIKAAEDYYKNVWKYRNKAYCNKTKQ